MAKHGGLLAMLEKYDLQRERDIAELEHELNEAHKKINELTSLLMSATAASDRKTLDLIMSGHFDSLRKTQDDSLKTP